MEGHIPLVLLTFAVIINVECKQPNNVCKTFQDYKTKLNNSQCWYNPDVTADASELILSHGYPLKIYEVITKDFYILQVFRIPPKSNNSKGIVFLQHPAFGSCVNWVDLGNISLAFLFADIGYDVWMGNFRGTIYSNKHVYLPTSSQEYWNYSFHENAIYDLPAQFDLVRRETGYQDKLYYISHSLSGTTAFVYASLLPKHAAENVKLFICWAPVVYLKHVMAPIKSIAPFSNLLEALGTKSNLTNVIPHNGLIHKKMIALCTETPCTIDRCVSVFQSELGCNPDYMVPERFPILIHQNFAGLSLKVLAHFGQMVKSGYRFQFYDYGTQKNLRCYRSKKPPLYPIRKIKIPMSLVYGGKDKLADEKDVLDLYRKLPRKARYSIKKIEQYGHLDFEYARDVEKTLFNDTINTVEQFT